VPVQVAFFRPQRYDRFTMSAIRSMPKTGRSLLCAAVFALALLTVQASAPAQQSQNNEPPPAAGTPGFDPFGSLARWLEESFAKMNSSFKNAKGEVDNFNREAGVAAKSTAEAAKDAADAVARLPNARVVNGHQTCAVSANGAPDCVAAAVAMCKAQGFKTGKSVDMTTAEECPAQVMLGRRAAAPGECKTITFLSRVLCQ
jgi:hypothetical protein